MAVSFCWLLLFPPQLLVVTAVLNAELRPTDGLSPSGGSRPLPQAAVSHSTSAPLILAKRKPLARSLSLSPSSHLTQAEQLSCLPGQELEPQDFGCGLVWCGRQWDVRLFCSTAASETFLFPPGRVLSTLSIPPPSGSSLCTHLYEVYEGVHRQHYSVMVHFGTLRSACLRRACCLVWSLCNRQAVVVFKRHDGGMMAAFVMWQCYIVALMKSLFFP